MALGNIDFSACNGYIYILNSDTVGVLPVRFQVMHKFIFYMVNYVL